MIEKDRLNDKFHSDSARYAHLRALDPELPDHVWSVIIRYAPRVPASQWQAVREFVIGNAVQMQFRKFETVRRHMTMASRFTAWVWTTTGSELTADRVFTERNVYRYLQDQYPKHSEGHRWGIARELASVARSLADTRVAQLPAPAPSTRRKPFTDAEIAAMHSWANSLSTTHKRQNASAILGLAGGAGLRSQDLVEIRLRDIDVVDGRLFVTVPGPNPRRVPVRHPWTRTLLRAIDGRANADEYVFRGHRLAEYPPHALQVFLTEHPCRIRPTVSRLRTSWIVDHINNGLPLHVLLAVTGLKNAASLDKFLMHARTPALDPYLGLLTGEELAR
ncbi:site-specific integrase [Microterricola pindariensis]|uniref:tyrosine-type recombinase/integrase n=1 Tax=Microterricola pindariensis TaxID=478010 RepID=UPI001374D81D|nr:tyrosine-type recombinase/integrase [Microterricola pindariensis]